jgi:hypothetical protein
LPGWNVSLQTYLARNGYPIIGLFDFFSFWANENGYDIESGLCILKLLLFQNPYR